MNFTDIRRAPARPLAAAWVLCSGLLLCAALPARAGWVDALLGQADARGEAAPAGAAQRVWRIGEFTRIELVPREAGAGDNQHPVSAQGPALRQQLARLQAKVQGARQPLFAADELAELVTPLAQALERAGPGDDVLLLSSARREGGILGRPKAVTARLFVQGGSLQFILHDARFDFYDAYRGTQLAPRFSYGARAAPSAAVLQSSGATAQRADWLSIPLDAPNAAPANPAPAAQPAAAFEPAAAVAAPAARKALDAGAADDIERRLETLKRLREKGLITEDEYRQKRKEILQLL